MNSKTPSSETAVIGPVRRSPTMLQQPTGADASVLDGRRSGVQSPSRAITLFAVQMPCRLLVRPLERCRRLVMRMPSNRPLFSIASRDCAGGVRSRRRRRSWHFRCRTRLPIGACQARAALEGAKMNAFSRARDSAVHVEIPCSLAKRNVRRYPLRCQARRTG